MTVDEYITSLRKKHNIFLSIEKNELRISAKSKADLTSELIEEIKGKKDQLVAFFNARTAAVEGSIKKAERKDYYSLSAAQHRLYFLYELNKSSVAYNILQVVRLENSFDGPRLREAFIQLIHRHDSLRTYFDVVDDRPVQRIAKEADLTIELLYAADGQTHRVVKDFKRPFDLRKPPLVRAGLVSEGSGGQILVIDIHHIISDGISNMILLEEFNRLCRGEALSHVRWQYADYVEWQGRPKQVAAMQEQEAYWMRSLAGALPILDLPLDHGRFEREDDSGGMVSVYLSNAEYDQLFACCKRYDVTMAILLYSLLSILLSKLSGQEDLIIGLSASGRNYPGMEQTVGLFVNALPVRVFPERRKNVAQLIREVKEAILAAYSNQDCPFDILVERLGVVRQAYRNPVFDVMLNMGAPLDKDVELTGVMVNVYEHTAETRRFDLTLNATEYRNTVHLQLQYDAGLFEAGTVERMLRYFRNLVGGLEGMEARKLLELSVETEEAMRRVEGTIPGNSGAMRAKGELIPASYHQERMWFIDRFEAGYLYSSHPVYHNASLRIDFFGQADGAKLEQRIREVVGRYEILRTVLVDVEDRPFQKVIAANELVFQEVIAEPGRLSQRMREEVDRPLSLDRLLVRATLFRSGGGGEGDVLLLVLHHAIVDRYSLCRVGREIMDLYHDREELSVKGWRLPYADFSVWQQGALLKLEPYYLGYWRQVLGSRVKAMELPTDRPRAAIHTYTGAVTGLSLGGELTGRVEAYAAGVGVEVELVLMSAFKVLLYRYAGHEEIVIGTSVANREASCLEGMIGPASNLVVVRSVVLPEMSFSQYVSVLDENYGSGRRYRGMPFDKLVKELAPEKDMSRTALFDVLYQYEDKRVEEAEEKEKGYRLSVSNLGYGKYDMSLLLRREGAGISGELVYNADYFDRSTMESFADHFYRLVGQLVERPEAKLSAAELLGEQERGELLGLLDGGEVGYPREATVVSLFGEQAARTPEGIAVQFGQERLSYRELDRRSAELGRYLRERGVRRESVVGLLVDRCAETVVGMLGILKAGGAYLPMDVDYPAERKEYMIKDSGMKTLLTLRGVETPAAEGVEVVRMEDAWEPRVAAEAAGVGFGAAEVEEAGPSDLCYVIYTSGTTGQPKGVMVEHRNVVRLLFNEAFGFSFGPQDVWTMFHSHCFDFSVWELYGALLYGGRVVIVPKMVSRDTGEYLRLLRREGVTVLNQTPSAFYNLMLEDERSGERLEGLRYVIFGGEALSCGKLKGWKQKYPEVKLINMYGITETTVHVTYKEIGESEIAAGVSNIGRPIPTLRGYVLDGQRRLVPKGVVGELYVGGAGVSRGYLGKEVLTRERFVDDPYRLGERVYRSGDLVRLLGSGELEYLGRGDGQVQLRGFRIELGEIEGRLRGYAGIRDVVVVMVEKGEEKYLAAYYVSEAELDGGELRSYLLERLPEYMAPSYYMRLERLPLTGNGKLDREGLPAVEVRAGGGYEGPANETEEKLVEIWAEILQLDKGLIGVTRSFFELGGHSLRATVMVNRVLRDLGIRLSLKEVFRHQDIRGLGRVIGDTARTGYTSIEKAGVKPWYKVSSAQKRLYFLYEFDKTSLAYNIQHLFRIEGDADARRINKAFNELIIRHEILRTSFDVVDGELVQKVLEPVPMTIQYLHTDENGIGDRIKEFIKPFDLNNGPLIRAGLITTGPGKHILMIDLHHIVSDGVSGDIMIKDFKALYNQEALPELRLQYKDYSEWQRSREQQNKIQKQKDFWITEFSDIPPIPDMPVDLARPAIKSYEGSSIRFQIEEKKTAQLKKIAESEGATLFMVLFALFDILLMKLSGQEDIVIGTAVAGRRHADLESMIGVFLNILPIRLHAEGDKSFREFLSVVNAKMLTCFENQDLPYEQLLDELSLERDTSRNPLFDILFLFQNYEMPELTMPGLTIRPYDHHPAESKFDLTLAATEKEGRLYLEWEYSTRLFKKETIERYIGYFGNIVAAIIGDVDGKLWGIDILSEPERRQLLEKFNDTALDYFRGDTVVSLFEKQVSKTPDKTAIVFEETCMTYAELNRRSDRLARFLRKECGVKPNDVVGVMMGRSDRMLVALLGTLKSGAGYLPIDPGYPRQRIDHILSDSEAPVLLVDEWAEGDLVYQGKIIHLEEAERYSANIPDPGLVCRADDLCYLIYTSGSTGVPKGVMITHKNVINFFAGMNERIPVGEEDSLLAITSTSFDISVLELFWTLCNGAEVVIHPSDIALSGLDRYVAGEDTTMEFSLFFFSSYSNEGKDKYHLLLESVKYADQQGFKAVWTPERHFHAFGGLFPNPSVIGAALAAITKHIGIRCGSVVSPLHDEVRIAEEWSVVDNLSGGRVGLSFASGWNPNDFALSDGRFRDRQKIMFEQIGTVQRLWNGESITRKNGFGQHATLQIFPRPVQKSLPVWVTSGGNEETFKSAGAIGANVLTHLLGQDIDDLERKIRLYRQSALENGQKPGKVTIMLHTYIGTDIAEVEKTVEKPFVEYLKSSIGLNKILLEEAGLKEEEVPEETKERALKNAFNRYYRTGSLIGTKSNCSELVRRLKRVGVDEIACLIDFGVPHEQVLNALGHLNELKQLFSGEKRKDRKPVTMMQSTPSFIKLLLADPGSAKFLPSLQKILIGGEALPGSLVNEVRKLSKASIYNMYGPTETTIWSCMSECDGKRVTIGKPIANTHIYVLNKHLQLAPVGVQGDLYIGGDGVSRGYWRRPELTRERFIDNPFSEGGVIYKTGDVAKWLPDGNLEFIGRSDHQVKIRGYRIELGEIESGMLTFGNIKEALVHAADDKNGGGKTLTGYLISVNPVDFGMLREHLGRRLPHYMIPAHFVRLDKFPLTPNGKINLKGLPEPEIKSSDSYTAPGTKAEMLLVEIWAKVLGVAQVGIEDNFFSLGGDSIKSIQIISRIRSAGYEVSVKDIFMGPTIRELAGKLRAIVSIADQTPVTGRVPLSPIQHWFFEHVPVDRHHYNHSVILNFSKGVTDQAVRSVFGKIQEQHDGLRTLFREEGGTIMQETPDTDLPVSLEEHDLRKEERPDDVIRAVASRLQASIDLSNGPLMKLGLFHKGDGSRLLIIIHHLVVDGISWRILLDDIKALFDQLALNKRLMLPLKTTSFQSWTKHLLQYADSKSFSGPLEVWKSLLRQKEVPVKRDHPSGMNVFGQSRTVLFRIDKETTTALLTRANAAYRSHINDILLSGLWFAVRKCFGNPALAVDLEGHGRESVVEADVSRTTGWFTSLFPVLLEGVGNSWAATVKKIKETLRSIPDNGIDYLIGRYYKSELFTGIDFSTSRIRFNYLGQFDTDTAGDMYSVSDEDTGSAIAPDSISLYDWDILGLVSGGELELSLRYSAQQYRDQTMERLMEEFQMALRLIIEHCCAVQKEELTPSDLRYKGLGMEQLLELQKIYAVEDVYTLSPMQEGIFFHWLLDPGSDQYFQQMTFDVEGDLDMRAIEASLNDLSKRYDVLRTAFVYNVHERPLQIVCRDRKIDLVLQDNEDEFPRKFILEKDSLIRLTILRRGEKKYKFIWNYHHILMDGWCLGIVINDFRSLYRQHLRGDSRPLSAVRPYGIYIDWLESRDKEASAAYWRGYLAGYGKVSGLPARELSLPGSGSHRLMQLELNVGKELTKKLLALSRECGVTLNTLLQTAWGILLGRYNDVEDVVFGSVVSGRPAEIAGVEEMVGLFINTIPVRIRCEDGMRIGQLLKSVQESALGSEPHHYHPLQEIQAASELGRGLLDHIMVMENYPVAELIEGKEAGTEHDFAISGAQMAERSNYNLTIVVMPGQELRIQFDYNELAYEREVIEGALVHYERILEQMGMDSRLEISGIALASEAERRELLTETGKTSISHSGDQTIMQLFENQARKTPQNIALRYGGALVTYGELHERIIRVAGYLREEGIGRGDLVGVSLDRGIDLIVFIYGILKAGGAYVSIDPSDPPGRVRMIVEDAGLKALITDRNRHYFRDAVKVLGTNPDIAWINPTGIWDGRMDATEDSLAYVIYTSGSTGKPKGVCVEHRSLVNVILSMQRQFPVEERDSYMFKTTSSFDVSCAEIFGWFPGGGSLTILEKGAEKDPSKILDEAERNGVTHMSFVPSMFAVFLDEVARCGAKRTGRIKHFLLAGESLPGEMVKRFYALNTHVRLVNVYGPTEATIYSSCYPVKVQPADVHVPIGKALDNIRLYIVDRHDHLQPVGIAGELCIGGAGLARGYLHDKDLTESRFVPDPFAGKGLMYRTGDRALRLRDGNIVFLGRRDNQVKIRGNRVELGEIENHLLGFAGMQGAVVDIRERAGEKFLAAYYVSGEEVPASALREYLQERLPAYMIPVHFTRLSSLPLTSAGKLDRKGLPEPMGTESGNLVAASNGIEEKLVAIWADVLKTDQRRISVTAGFFESGGHSIKAIRLLNRIQDEMSARIELKDIFLCPTIQQMSSLIAARIQPAVRKIPKAEKREFYPASFAQERLFYEQQSDHRSLASNISGAYEIIGEASADKLAEAFRHVISAHESLRTSFLLYGSDVIQKIWKEVVFDLVLLEEKNKPVLEVLRDFTQAFDLSKPGLIRAGLLKGGEGRKYLLIDIHHIICDGVSLNMLVNDFKRSCSGKMLRQEGLGYADYAVWQKITAKIADRREAYWAKQLAGDLPEIEMPLLRRRETVKSYAGRIDEIQISDQRYKEIQKAAAAHNVSEFMFLLSVYYILLAKVSGQDDIIVGCDAVGRPHSDLEGVVGTFVNVLPLRVRMQESAPYHVFLDNVKTVVLEAFDNQEYQRDELSPIGSGRKGRLVNVYFSYGNLWEEREVGNRTSFIPVRFEGFEKSVRYELELSAYNENGRLFLQFIYSKELYSEELISALKEYYLNVLHTVLQDRNITLETIGLAAAPAEIHA